MGQEKRIFQHDRNSAYIDYRVYELSDAQQNSGLEFGSLYDCRMNGVEGRVMVIVNKGILLQQSELKDMPADHQELLSDDNLKQTLLDSDCIHLVSTSGEKRLGMSLIFSQPFEDGSFNVTMIRREGGGVNHRMFTVTNNELLFVVANDVSLTAKQGLMKRLRRAGVEVDRNWEKQRVRMLE